MARAAVKAKQQAKAKAQPTKPARGRGRRRHSGGGNPNQQLFFVRLRRGQKWLYGLLALVFAVGFAGIGVGSGNGGGLDQLYTGLFGGGASSSVSKAQDEIKKNPAKGYRLLATAYEEKGDNLQAINALQSYLSYKKKDATAWGELGGLQLSQGNTYATQYRQAQLSAQAADPSAPFQPGGALGGAVGQNPAYQAAAQNAASTTNVLYQQAIASFGAAVTDYQHASGIRPRNATYLQELATAAQTAGNNPVAIQAYKRYLNVYPNAPLRAQIEQQIKQLSKGAPSVSTGNGKKSKSGK
jgi:tetratricopeptide (TPR) repeat protein